MSDLGISEKNNTKAKIIKAATELFGEKGYNSTSIQDICRKAGVSKGGLFYYFSAKEEILFLIHDEFISYELERAYKIINEDKSYALILKDLIVDLVESIGKFKPYVTVFFQERKFFSQESFASIREKRDEYEDIFFEVIKKGIKSNEFKDNINPRIIVKSIFGMCNWTYQWYKKSGDLSAEEIGEIYYKIILNGIKNNL